jgi:hypothetical protein
MSTIGKSNDLPDFGDIRPLIRPEDLTGLNLAIEQFDSMLTDFSAAVDDAEKAVTLTLAWIGVGEKLLGLANTILQRQTTQAASSSSPRADVATLTSKLGSLSSLCASLIEMLPGLPA